MNWKLFFGFSLLLGIMNPNGVPYLKGESSGKILRYAIPHEHPVNVDPIDAQFINIQPLFQAVYTTLYRLDNNLRPYPLLIDKTEKQGETVIFELKKEARFSNGVEITAADVVASLESGITRSNYPNPVYKVIAGGEEFTNGRGTHCSGISVLSPRKFQIRFTQPNCQFEAYFTSTNFSILPVGRNQNKAEWAFSGYFSIEKLEVLNGRTVAALKRNKYYLGKSTRIEALNMEFWSRHNDFERIILNGEPDLFLYNRGQKMPRSFYKYNYFKTPNFGAFYIQLNPVKGPFANKQLREFLKCFLISQNFFKEEDWRLFIPTSLVLPYSLSGYFVFQPITPCPFETLKPPKPITIKCVNVDSGIRPKLLVILQKKLKKYNLNLQLHWDTLKNIQQMMREKSLDLTSIYYMTEVPLSSYFYEMVFLPGQELNLFNFDNPEAIQLLGQYRGETSELKKLRMLSRLEEIAQEEAFLIPLGTSLSLLGYKNFLTNVGIDKFLNINFEEMDVKKGY